jgi:hypothetical protein
VQLRVLFLLLGDVERALERGDLAAQRADLLIENLDLRDGARGRRLLEIDLRTEPADFGLAGVVARLRALGGTAYPVALAFDGGERGAQLRDLGLEARFAGPLQRQKLGEARDLRGQAVICCDRKNCATMNTVSKKMIERTSVDSASTKPGQ